MLEAFKFALKTLYVGTEEDWFRGVRERGGKAGEDKELTFIWDRIIGIRIVWVS